MTATTDNVIRSLSSGRFFVMILLLVICMMTVQSANCQKKVDVFDVLVDYLKKPASRSQSTKVSRARATKKSVDSNTDSCTLQCSSSSNGIHDYQKCVDQCKLFSSSGKKGKKGNTELYDTLASKVFKFSQFKKLIFGSENEKTTGVSENCQKCLDVCIKDKRGPACYGHCGMKSYCTFEDISIAPNLLNFVQ